MSDDLVERARTAAEKVYGTQFFNVEIEAAIAVALEEAAKVADGWVGCPEWSADTNSGYECASREIAAAIRALVKNG